MAKKKESRYDIALREYGEALAKAERKYKRQLRKDPEITPEAFGLSSSMFDVLKSDTKSGRPSIRQVRSKTAQLTEFTDRKYGLKKIGTAIEGGQEKGVYMPKNMFKEAMASINAENRFRTTLAKAIEKAGGYSYARLTKNGIVKEKSNMYNATITKSSDFVPVRINIVGGPTIGYKGKQISREVNLSASNFKQQYGTYKGGKAVSVHDTRVQNLMNNWLTGLENSVSKHFASQIKRILKELNVDAIDFLGLFHLSSAFDFEFIYDETLTVANKREEIKSEIEVFRNDKKSYTAFRKEMEKLD